MARKTDLLQRYVNYLFRIPYAATNPAAVHLPIQSQTLFGTQPQQFIDDADDTVPWMFDHLADRLCSFRRCLHSGRISLDRVGQTTRSSSKPVPAPN